MSDYELGELQRATAGIVRFGTISELDVANARVRVKTGGLETDWLPWVTARAGATRTWSAPRVGEQVVVLAESGNPSQGAVIPSIYQDNHPAPANSQDIEATVYPDGSRVEYDSASHTLTVTVGTGNVVVNCKAAAVNCETAAVKASTSVTMDTPDTICTGNLTVAKSINMGAGGGGSMSINGPVAFNGASLTHNGKNVGATHAHANSGGTGTGGQPV